MSYSPDGWAIIKINGTDPHYRIFGGWRGGYTTGDNWRLNSGITGVTEEGDYYIFKGHSGSEYHCHKKGYGELGPYNSSVIDDMVAKSGSNMEALYEMPDIMNMNWIIS